MSTITSPQPTHSRAPSVWAFLLIGIGVIWLLGQAGILSTANFAVLARVWPIVLIAFGIDLLFGRQRGLSMLIGLVTILVLVVLMFVGPQIGLVQSFELVEDSYSEPLGDVQSAQINLNMGVGSLDVAALQDSADLITIDSSHYGTATFFVSGSATEPVVTFRTQEDGINNGGLFPFFIDASDGELLSTVRLAAGVPLDLNVNGGVGDAQIDLTGMLISDLDVNSGVGDIDLVLPASAERYNVRLQGGVGGATVTISEGAALALYLNSGVGGFTLDVPDNGAVRVNVNGGLGGVSAPGWLDRTRGGDDNNGTWESAAYRDAAANERIDIEVSGGVGGLTIR